MEDEADLDEDLSVYESKAASAAATATAAPDSAPTAAKAAAPTSTSPAPAATAAAGSVTAAATTTTTAATTAESTANAAAAAQATAAASAESAAKRERMKRHRQLLSHPSVQRALSLFWMTHVSEQIQLEVGAKNSDEKQQQKWGNETPARGGARSPSPVRPPATPNTATAQASDPNATDEVGTMSLWPFVSLYMRISRALFPFQTQTQISALSGGAAADSKESGASHPTLSISVPSAPTTVIVTSDAPEAEAGVVAVGASRVYRRAIRDFRKFARAPNASASSASSAFSTTTTSLSSTATGSELGQALSSTTDFTSKSAGSSSEVGELCLTETQVKERLYHLTRRWATTLDPQTYCRLLIAIFKQIAVCRVLCRTCRCVLILHCTCVCRSIFTVF